MTNSAALGFDHNEKLPVVVGAFTRLCSQAFVFAVAALVLGFASKARANPTGGTVVAGTASIGNSGAGTVVVTQTSDRTIINWNDFSIGAGELTSFVQPSVTAAILNRVTGSNPSALLGQLQANGQVFLINPNGIVVGQGATISAGAFAASTLDVSNANFLAGKDLTFSGQSAAAVVNLGSITASQGDIYLIAQQVTNAGSLNAANGTVGLAAGTQVTLTQNGSEHVLVGSPTTVGGSGAAVLNSGTIQAAQAELRAADGNLYALAINNTGVVRATGTQTVGGHLYLIADGDVNAGGALDASATSTTGAGGQAMVTGANVTVSNDAVIAANGGTQGGTILIGGDRAGGSNPTITFSTTPVADAQTTTIQPGAVIAANGGTGNGGNVVVWSSNATNFEGMITAQGGPGASGGFAEVSSRGVLNFQGTADLTAPGGTFGNLLLDPENVTISSGTTANGSLSGGTFAPTGDTSVLNVATLQAALGTASVTVSTGSSGSQNGDITLASPLTWTAPVGGSKLTLTAAGTLTINGALTVPANGGLALNYGTGLNFNLTNSGFGGKVTFTSPSTSALSINSNAYTLLSTVTDLTTNVTGTGYYALANTVDVTSGTPYNNHLMSGSGTIFEGLGNAISNLSISSTGGGNTGLWSNTGATVRDLAVTNATVAVSNGNGSAIGILTGLLTGALTQDYTTGSVTLGGAVVSSYGGGMVGDAGNNSSLTGCWSSASVAINVTNNSSQGANFAGGLLGFQGAGAATDSYATGAVSDISTGTGTGGNVGSIGGFVGNTNSGSLVYTNCYATGSVSSSTPASIDVGGFAGYLKGTTTNGCYATGSVAVTEPNGINGNSGAQVGGFVGQTDRSSVNTSYSTGAVTVSNFNGAGAFYVGGFIGQDYFPGYGSCYSTGAVIFTENNGNTAITDDIGGFGGSSSGQPAGTYATGNVTINGSGLSAVSVGGFTGLGGNTGGAANACYATGSVTDNHTGAIDDVGGFAGTEDRGMTSDYATGAVVAVGSANVGGLVGLLGRSLTIASSYATGSVSSSGSSNVGGLVGSAGGSSSISTTINQESYATGNVSTAGSGTSNVGGLVGLNSAGGQATIDDAFATGNVSTSGSGNDSVGGLVGTNSSSSTTAGVIGQSFATGNVSTTGTGNPVLGGLVGSDLVSGSPSGNHGIYQAYARGTVSGDVGTLGGLIGVNNTIVKEAYESGLVSAAGSATGGSEIGATQGGAAYTSVYYDNTVNSSLASVGSGGSVSGISGLSTTALLQGTLPAGFNVGNNVFQNTTTSWVDRAGGYPVFGYQPSLSGTVYAGLDSTTALAGALVSGYYNGTYFNSTSQATDSTGTYTVSPAGIATIPTAKAGTEILLYLTSASSGGATGFALYDAPASLSGLNVYANTIYLSSPSDQSVSGLLGDLSEALTGSSSTFTSLAGFSSKLSALTLPTPASNASLDLSITGSFNVDQSLSSGGTMVIGATTGVTENSGATLTATDLKVTGNSVNLGSANSIGTVAISSTGAVTFDNASALTVGTVDGRYGVSGSGAVLIDATGNLSLASGSGAAVSGSASGNAVVLVTGGAFVNQEGSSALNASGGGRWLVWSSNPANDTLGSLAFGFKQYDATFGVSTAAAGTGNGVLYTLAPTITPTLTGTVSKTYDGTVTATLASGNSGSTGEISGDTVTLSAPASVSYDTANAGGPNKTVTASGISIVSATDGGMPVYGYTLGATTASGQIGTITPATLTYTANAGSRDYGAANPTFTGMLSGFVNGETQTTATTGTLSFTTSATQSSNVGSYAVSGSGLTADNGNYVFVQAAANATALTINPATLTYTATPVGQSYGTAIPALAGTVTGYVLGQNQSTATTGTLSFATPASQSSNVGSYAIDGSGLTANNGNYAFAQAAANGTALTINPATLTYTATPVGQSYGTAIPTLAGTVTGYVLGQNQSTATTGAVNFTTPATQSSNVGGYAIDGSGLTANSGNYTFVQAAGNSTALAIAASTLTYTATPVSQSYGTAIPTLAGTVTGYVLGQNQSTATTGTLGFATPATQSSNVGSYGINGSGLTANNGNYVFVQAAANSAALTINPATLMYTGTPVSQTYGTAIPTLAGTVTGYVLGQNQSTATTGTLRFTTSATQSSNVGSYAIDGSGLTANNGNYVFAQATGNSTALAVNPATLTYTGTPVSQTYGSAIPTLVGTVTGYVLGQNQSTATTGALSFATPAIQSSNAGSYQINGSGLIADNGNYVFAQAAANGTALTITPATLTYTGTPVSQIYGTAIPTLAGTVTGYVLGQNQSTATTGALSFATPATQSSNVGSYAISGSGLTADNGNYVFVQAAANSTALTINPATLTYTGTPVSQTYGTAIPTLVGTVTGYVLGQNQATATTGTLSFATPASQSSNVGSYAIDGSGLTANSGNYVFAQAAGNAAGLTVNAATLTYTATPVSQTYGAAIPTLAGTVTGYVLGQNQATATTGILSFTTPATQSSNVSSYAIDGSGLTANNGNYVFAQAVANSTALTISPATLTYTATPVSQIYGTMIPALAGTVTGYVLGQNQAAATTGTLGFATSATQSSNVSSYAIDGSGLTANNGNYVFAQAVANSTALTINAATLTYTANPVSRTYGSANPTLTGTVTGFVAGDTQLSATTGTTTFTTAASASSDVGTYGITGSGLTANHGDYVFVQAAQNRTALTIAPATLTAILTAGLTGTATKMYDGTTAASLAAGNYTLNGVVNDDSVGLNDPTVGIYASKDAGTGIEVTVSGLALTGTKAFDYTLTTTSVSGDIGTITPATVTASLTGSVTKIYDGTASAALSAGNYALSGLISRDAVTLNDPATGTYASKNAGAGIGVNVIGLTLSGAAASDYSLTSTTVSGNVGVITPATLTAGLVGTVGKAYDGTTAASLGVGNYALSGLISGDAVTLNDPATGTYASKDAGTGLDVSVTGLTITGTGASNYILASSSVSANVGSITPATLTYTSDPATAFAGGTLPAFTGTLSGFVGGDTLSSATAGSLSFVTTANGTSAAGSYPIDGSGLTAANYTFVQAGANATALTLQPPTTTQTTPVTVATTTLPNNPVPPLSGFGFGSALGGSPGAPSQTPSTTTLPADSGQADISIIVGRFTITYQTNLVDGLEVGAGQNDSLQQSSSYSTFDSSEHPSIQLNHKDQDQNGNNKNPTGTP